MERIALPLSNAAVMAELLETTQWRAESVTLWGKRHMQPRLVAWHGDLGAFYRYSGTTFTPLPWTALLGQIRAAVESACGCRFNSVLLNLYRDQNDCMGFHSDDEPELGPEPRIASLSFGATRIFVLKHKTRPEIKPLRLALGDGNLLLMGGALQRNWRHGINRQAAPSGPRVNLTFRQIAIVPCSPPVPARGEAVRG